MGEIGSCIRKFDIHRLRFDKHRVDQERIDEWTRGELARGELARGELARQKKPAGWRVKFEAVIDRISQTWQF